MRHRTVAPAAHSLLLPLLFLCGCGLLPNSTSVQSTPVVQLQVGGRVHGGNQPVTGATVQLWKVGTSGYGLGASALGSAVTSGAGGSFSLAGAFTCPTANTLVYVTATGGNPGLASGTNNSALVMMAAIGTCGSLTSSTFITINEVTTVAAVYALQQFMSPAGNIGSYNSATSGLVNAFNTVNNLVNSSTGAALSVTPNGNGVVPQAEIDTLANVLVPCVNSTGPTSSACAALFSAATPSGGSMPANTLSAALSIAQNPAQNQTALYNLALPNAAFQPTLSAVPNDWTVALSYSTGSPTAFALAIDSSGDIWVTDAANNTLSAMSNTGQLASNSPYSNASALNNPEGIAVDNNNNIWIANFSNNTAMEFGLSGHAINTISGPYIGIGLSGPNSVAVDGSNNIWFGNYNGNSIVELTNGGAGSTFSYPSIAKPNSLAVDSNGDVWAANFGNGSITEIFSGSSGSISYVGGGLNSPAAIAVGSGGNIWATDSSLGQLSELSNGGVPISSSSGYTGGGLTSGYGVAIDGAGNVWIPDNTANRLTEFNTAGTAISPSTGFQGGSLGTPRELAIDASGNIWVANRNPLTVNSAAQTVSEFVGLAAPASASLVSAVSTNTIATRPGSLAIASTGINSATLSSPYTYTFAANGGSGSYTWSLISGLSALQAGGLNFTSGGVLSGTPTAVNNYSFTVQVTDTVTGLTSSATYTLNVKSTTQSVCSHNGSGNAILNGTYAFELSGYDPNGNYFAEIGNFTANGSGTISNGNGDVNSAGFASAGEQQYTFSGTYSIGSTDNRGILNATNTNTTATGLPASTFYCFAANSITSGVAAGGHIIQADGSGFLLTGTFAMQNSSSYTNASMNGGYAYGDQGVVGGLSGTTTIPVHATSIGQIIFNGAGGISGGQLDFGQYNPAHSNSTYSAANPVSTTSSSYSVASNGRVTVTLTAGGFTTSYILYLTGSGNQSYVLSSGNWVTNGLYVGKAIQQTTTAFTTANVKATAIFSGQGTTNGTPNADVVRVGQYVFDGAGNFTTLTDQNSGGNITSPSSPATGTYTVSSIGYLTLSTGPAYYLYAPGAGFGSGTGSSLVAFMMLPQNVPSGGFTSSYLNTYLSGNYAASTLFPEAYYSSNNFAGPYPFIFDVSANFASGTASIVQDAGQAPGTAGSVGADSINNNSYTLDPTWGPTAGRFLIVNGNQINVVGYIISPTQVFLIQNQAGSDSLVIQGDHW